MGGPRRCRQPPLACDLGAWGSPAARGRAVGRGAWGLESFGARTRGDWGCGLGPGVCGCLRDLGAAPRPNLNWSRVHFTALLGRRQVSSGSAHMRACHRDRASFRLWSTQHFIHSGLIANGHRPLRRERSPSSGGGVGGPWACGPRVGAALLTAAVCFAELAAAELQCCPTKEISKGLSFLSPFQSVNEVSRFLLVLWIKAARSVPKIRSFVSYLKWARILLLF